VVSEAKARSRRDSKQETREALIQAGMSLFSEEGVDLPSLDAICARAGFTRGAFYVHFRNRDDFLAAVMDRALVTFVDTMLAASEGGNDISDTIGRFVMAASQGKVPLVGHQRLMLHLMTRGVQRAETLRARFKALIEHALARLAFAAENSQRAGAVKSEVEPELIATWLVAAALGLSTLIDFGIDVDLRRLQHSARQLLRIDVS
jgi:TetR/AcrR family transcriptional regulator, transcriptional repressor for nem operon